MKGETIMTTPFTNYFGKEVFISKITKKSPAEVVAACMAISLIFGVDRVEAAIKNTYPADSSHIIIEMMNVAMANY
jgi:hypothetical protein